MAADEEILTGNIDRRMFYNPNGPPSWNTAAWLCVVVVVVYLFCFSQRYVCISDVLDENQSKLSEDLMEFRRDASMLNVSVHF